MRVDLEDLFGHTLAGILSLFFYVLAAAWLGSLAAAVSWLVGTGQPFSGTLYGQMKDSWMTPQLLINPWIFVNLAILAIITGYLMISGELSHRMWGILFAIESFFAMAGGNYGTTGILENTIIWSSWLTLVATVEIAVWYWHRRSHLRLKKEIEDVRVENHIRTVERAMAAWF